jgi:hypothetical protein
LRHVMAARDPQLVRGLQLELLQGRLNKTQAVLAAMFDLLTGQCDRHAKVGDRCPKGRGACIDFEWRSLSMRTGVATVYHNRGFIDGRTLRRVPFILG